MELNLDSNDIDVSWPADAELRVAWPNVTDALMEIIDRVRDLEVRIENLEAQ